MFEVEKPRRFHYEPRFYDPEKEKWEALKKKYAMQKEAEAVRQQREEAAAEGEESKDELAYFEQRVRTIDRQARQASTRLTWRDLFRKRSMPTFNYQPRFSGAGSQEAAQGDGKPAQGDDAVIDKYRQPKHLIKIHRRFDISDPDYMKPIPGTKIILYCFIAFLLLSVIIMF